MLSKLKSMIFNFNSNRTKPSKLYVLHCDYFTEISIQMARTTNALADFDCFNLNNKFFYTGIKQDKWGNWISTHTCLSVNNELELHCDN